ncbi:hypothetical protein NMY22_g4873 [Coprinellus aureogranulatus]|nr:hypothetical protein NMY22_g4873 [Coprinellus aureogranulatus]
MYHSTSSTTTINPAVRAGQPLRIPLIPRGPSLQSPMTLSPVGDSFYGLHNIPNSRASSNHGSTGWRNHQPTAMEPPMAPRMHTVPLPRLSEEHVDINPLLERVPNSWIEWDLTTSPRHATLDSRRRATSQYPFNEPATRPFLPSVTIRTPFSTRPVVIHRYGSLITVADVLTRVHEHLRECASEAISPPPMTGPLGVPQHSGMVSEAQIQHALAQLLGRKSRWAGLSPARRSQMFGCFMFDEPAISSLLKPTLIAFTPINTRRPVSATGHRLRRRHCSSALSTPLPQQRANRSPL